MVQNFFFHCSAREVEAPPPLPPSQILATVLNVFCLECNDVLRVHYKIN